jgi:hypothetical protein
MSKSAGADLIAARGSASSFRRPTREQAETYERLKAAMNDEAKANWSDANWHREIAMLISQQLDYGFRYDNPFGDYFDVVNVPEDETLVIEERRGLQVYWTAKGGYIEETQLKTTRWQLPRDTIGFHVSAFDDKLRLNFADTLEALVTLAEQRLDAEINRRMFTLLQQAITNVSEYYVDASGGLTLDILNTAVREVKDAIKPSNSGPVPITIIGRATMIDQISDLVTDPSALFDPTATEEIRLRGRLGVYRNANVQELRNWTDENDLSYFPANELWVFGGGVGKFAYYGGMQTKQWEENESDYRHYRGRRDVGGLIYHPEQARRIVDGTVSP